MPQCDGKPNIPCSVNDNTVKGSQGDLMLCPACNEYRFPRQSTTSVNRANDNAKDIEKARDNNKGIPEDTQQLTGRQKASASAVRTFQKVW